MISQRADMMTPFYVMEILEKAEKMERAGESVIHLEIGEPDFPTPACIRDAGIRAIKEGKTGYTHSLGLRELREAISRFHHARYGVEVHPDQIIITGGSSPAMFLVFASLIETGDEVVLSNPHYACYPHFIQFLGGISKFVPLRESEDFQMLPREVKAQISPRTKAIVINSPSNPTGHLLSAANIEEIAALGPLIISDEIYHGLVYEGRERSILEFSSNAVVLNGFSKRYAMTGWRLGYAIVPPRLIGTLQKLHQNFFISANAFVQWAGIAALEEADSDVEEMRKTYDQRRLLMVDRLQDLGFAVASPPNGAFYVFVNARHYNGNSLDFAFQILERAKVGVTPGIDFGDRGEGYLRFCYANSAENIEEGMNRLDGFLRSLR
jgi:(5-formylfuran-3-yl)methyl phosphate transaminase